MNRHIVAEKLVGMAMNKLTYCGREDETSHYVNNVTDDISAITDVVIHQGVVKITISLLIKNSVVVKAVVTDLTQGGNTSSIIHYGDDEVSDPDKSNTTILSYQQELISVLIGPLSLSNKLKEEPTYIGHAIKSAEDVYDALEDKGLVKYDAYCDEIFETPDVPKLLRITHQGVYNSWSSLSCHYVLVVGNDAFEFSDIHGHIFLNYSNMCDNKVTLNDVASIDLKYCRSNSGEICNPTKFLSEMLRLIENHKKSTI